MRKGTLIKILVCFLVVVGLGMIWYFNNKEYTVIVTTPDGKEIEIPDDFDSDLGKQFIIDMGVDEYKEYKKGFKQLDIEYNTEFGDRYVTRGTEYNFTVPTYLKNKWGDAISDFDIKTNTVVTGLASQGNDVYVFLKVLSKVIQKEANSKGNNAFNRYSIFSLLHYENIDSKVVEDLFSGDEFITNITLKLMDSDYVPVEIANAFTESAELTSKHFFGDRNKDFLVATAAINADGEMTKWYALLDDPTEYGEKVQIYYGYLEVSQEEREFNEVFKAHDYDNMWIALIQVGLEANQRLQFVDKIETDNAYIYTPAKRIQSRRSEKTTETNIAQD